MDHICNPPVLEVPTGSQLFTKPDLEVISPAKFCVAILICNYCHYVRAEDRTIAKAFLKPDEERQCAQITPRQRKKMCVLLLKLIQGTDLSMKELLARLTDPKLDIPHGFVVAFTRTLVAMVNDDNAEGCLMDRAETVIRLIFVDDTSMCNGTSVIGFYIRSFYHQLDQFSFSEYTNLYENFKVYVENAKLDLQKIFEPNNEFESEEVENMNLETSLCSQEVQEITDEKKKKNKTDKKVITDEDEVVMNEIEEEIEKRFRKKDFLVHSKKQSEFYIAQQVELLQNCEMSADSPEEIEKMSDQILDCNPHMSESYFLSYLNCLRINEYSGALHNLRFGSTLDGTKAAPDDITRGFRYAALNLCALHAHFKHQDSALNALKEAIMMAQEANDHVCLQHALSWLYRIKDETPDNKKRLLHNLIRKCGDLNMDYLKGLELQSLAQFITLIGGHPSVVWDQLTKSDMMALQGSNTKIMTIAFAQKSAFWNLYGRTRQSTIVSQLLLNLDTSDPRRKGEYVTNEPLVLAICNVARKLYDSGHVKASDKVLGLAKHLFKNSSTPNGVLWRCCELEIQFRKALHKTDWIEADSCLNKLIPLDERESDFLRLQLELWRGDGKAVMITLKRLSNGKRDKSLKDQSKSFPPAYQVRLLVAEAEWFCLCSSYSYAMPPLLSALSICSSKHLEYLEAIVRLHIAHVKLQLDLPLDSLEEIRLLLPLILSQDDCFESARAHLLCAKSLIASSAAISHNSKMENSKNNKNHSSSNVSMEARRADFLLGIKHLKRALEGFRLMQSHHRVKDVLYMMARLYHALEMVPERNAASAEFKKLEEHEPTNMGSKLARML